MGQIKSIAVWWSNTRKIIYTHKLKRRKIWSSFCGAAGLVGSLQRQDAGSIPAWHSGLKIQHHQSCGIGRKAARIGSVAQEHHLPWGGQKRKKKKKKKKKEIKKKKFTLLPDNFVVSADIVFKIRSFSKLLCMKQRK